MLLPAALALAIAGGAAPEEPRYGLERLSLAFGLGQIGEDYYFRTGLNLDLELGRIALGLSAPLNLLVWDSAPSPGLRDQKTYSNFIRRADWDEASDYAKFVRSVRLGKKRDPFYLQVGQLWNVALGHGTLLGRYSNSIQLDHSRTGVVLDHNRAEGGVESLLDNVFGPQLLGARAFVRPLVFRWPESFLAQRLALGLTGVVDVSAPRKVAGEYADGVPVSLTVDRHSNFVVATHAAQPALGLDLELTIRQSEILDLVPYVDLNRVAGAGNGLHAGIQLQFSLPVLIKLGLTANLEYRLMSPGYLPVYFDAFYDVQRFTYGDRGLTKAAEARRLEGTPVQGVYGEARANVNGWVQGSVVYEDYQGTEGSTLGIWGELPAFETVKLAVTYLRKNFHGPAEAFLLDDRSILQASLRVKYKIVVFVLGLNRSWTTLPGPPAHIKAVNDFGFGVDLAL